MAPSRFEASHYVTNSHYLDVTGVNYGRYAITAFWIMTLIVCLSAFVEGAPVLPRATRTEAWTTGW